MNFALLGDDVSAIPLLEAIRDRTDHQITHVFGAEQRLDEVLTLCGGARVEPEWEQLIVNADLQAVIVATENEAILEAVRQFAIAGKSVLLLPRLSHGISLVYELSLAWEESQATLFPAMPTLYQPALQHVRGVLQEDRIGSLEHLHWEREVSGKAITERECSTHLLSDLAVLRSFGGEYSSVTAISFPPEGESFSRITVTLAGEHSTDTTWLLRAGSEDRWTLSLVGERGRIELTCTAPDNAFFLFIEQTGEQGETEEFSDTIPADHTGEVLLDAFHLISEQQSSQFAWVELTRCYETVTGAERSRMKRRTIDLHFDTMSEQGVFKSQMTTLGCSMLLLILGVFVTMFVADAIFRVPQGIVKGILLLLFVPLGTFLAGQMLLLIARSPSD